MMRHENILAALGGKRLDEAIECTRAALDQQWRPSQLSVSTANGRICLTQEERYAIGKVIREMLEARLCVLENEVE
ncbi:hypothetical protein [Vreelandella olivaria]|uniref:hypothetical protein n=1 Tax=Vreelandella olivaria TaxID=390919 RepID=UPI00201F99A7|nr:hypothetical protein [Halomonas olivaria]